MAAALPLVTGIYWIWVCLSTGFGGQDLFVEVRDPLSHGIPGVGLRNPSRVVSHCPSPLPVHEQEDSGGDRVDVLPWDNEAVYPFTDQVPRANAGADDDGERGGHGLQHGHSEGVEGGKDGVEVGGQVEILHPLPTNAGKVNVAAETGASSQTAVPALVALADDIAPDVLAGVADVNALVEAYLAEQEKPPAETGEETESADVDRQASPGP